MIILEISVTIASQNKVKDRDKDKVKDRDKVKDKALIKQWMKNIQTIKVFACTVSIQVHI